jgi:hypothetical protein
VTVSFLADEDLDNDIIRGLRSREPAIDILDVKTAGLRGTGDSELLSVAAEQDRILITHDRRTMTRHFYQRVHDGTLAPGLFILPQRQGAIGEVIESFLLVWTASQADESRNQIAYLPFR